MTFAEFYHASTGWNGRDFSGPVKLIPACGDRAVIILDGRNSVDTQAALAREACAARGFKGFTLNKGASFTQSREIRALETLT